MKLSISILTLRRDALFERCMRSVERSIAAADADALEYELVVVEGVTPVGAARNEALRRMKGDWIATVDADDEVEEPWFGEICSAVREAEKPGSEIDDIVFDMTVVRGGREIAHRYGRSGTVGAQVVVADILRDMRLGGHLVRHVSRRSLWAAIRFADVRVAEDALVLPQVLAKARRVLPVACPVYRYIERTSSLCATTTSIAFFEQAVVRTMRFGGPAAVGACVAAYNCLYDRADRNGAARSWIRRNLIAALGDREVSGKWKLKFLLAALGIVIRRSK